MRSLIRLFVLLVCVLSFRAVQAQDGPAKSFPAYGEAFSSRQSPDGRLLATFENGVIYSNEIVPEYLPVRVYDVTTGQAVATLDGEPDYAVDVAFSPDSSRLVALYPTGWLHIWNLADGSTVARLPIAPNGLRVAWMPDGDTIAVAAGQLPQVQLWDVNSGDMTALLTERFETRLEQQNAFSDGPPDGLAAFTVSPDGSRFAIATYYGRIHLWTPAGAMTLLYDAEYESPYFPFRDLVFSADSRRLIVADNRNRVVFDLSADDGRVLNEIESPDARLLTLAVSDDGMRGAWLATPEGADSLIVIADLTTGETQTLPLPTDESNSWTTPMVGLFFSADGRQLILTGRFVPGTDPATNSVYVLTLPE